jgi:hypothetical protein
MTTKSSEGHVARHARIQTARRMPDYRRMLSTTNTGVSALRFYSSVVSAKSGNAFATFT